MNIAQAIAKIRQGRGMTRKELAEKTNFAPGLIVQIEIEHYNPTDYDLERLSNALEVDVEAVQLFAALMGELPDTGGEGMKKVREELAPLMLEELADVYELDFSKGEPDPEG